MRLLETKKTEVETNPNKPYIQLVYYEEPQNQHVIRRSARGHGPKEKQIPQNVQ